MFSKKKSELPRKLTSYKISQVKCLVKKTKIFAHQTHSKNRVGEMHQI